MKNYTKQITAIAVLSLFAYSAKAQVASVNSTSGSPIDGPTAGLTIAPAADVAAGNLVIDTDGELVGTPTLVVNPDGSATITTVTKLGEAKEEYTVGTVVGGGDSVEITNTGINLNQTSTATTEVTVDRRLTQIVEVDAGGNTVTTWRAEAIAADGTTVIRSYTSASDVSTGSGTFESAADAETSLNEWLDGTDSESLTINDGIFQGAEGDPVLSGGELRVGGVLSLNGADPDGDPNTNDGYAEVSNVAEALSFVGEALSLGGERITTNTNDITTLNGDVAVVGSVDNKVAALANGAVQTNAGDITILNGDVAVVGSVDNKVAALANGAVQTNADDISALTETVFSDDLEAGSVGIAGVVEKRADGTIKLGENSFLLDDTTTSHVLTATNDGTGITATEIILGGDSSRTTEIESVDIRVANDLFVDGDLNIAGLTGDVASRINSNSSAIANNSNRIASNKKDIEQNTRGIAMVAALQHTTVLPGMNNAFDLSAAHFEGETGLALNYARRINENVQINFGAASTTDFDESVIKAGIGVQW